MRARRSRQRRYRRLGLETLESRQMLTFPNTGIPDPVFLNPVGGVPNQEWGIGNYVDLDPGPGVADYRGGPFGYDGHNGHDITIAGFEQQDAGIPVYAAAAGTVVATHDGEGDRCPIDPSHCNDWNFVEIAHGGGWTTTYGHLRKDSVAVSVGDDVGAGQFLGFVGSSGHSTFPHLHWAVYHLDQPVEVYLDPARLLLDPVPYPGDHPFVIDFATSLTSGNEHTRGAEQEIFSMTETPRIWYRAFVTARTQQDVIWYRPDGTELDRWTHRGDSYGLYFHGLWWLSPEPGWWHIGIEFDGVEVARTSFLRTTEVKPRVKVSEYGTNYTVVSNGTSTPVLFDPVMVGGVGSTRTITVRNVGNDTLTLGSLTVPPGFTVLDGLAASIAPGEADLITLRIDTAAPGLKSGNVSFATNDADQPLFSFPLEGVVTDLSLAFTWTNAPGESGVASVSGTVTRSAFGLHRPMTVHLSSSDALRARVPPRVTIPPGATSVGFALDVADFSALDADPPVKITGSTLGAVTARADLVVPDPPAAPTAVDLVAASDSGVSDSDDVTNVALSTIEILGAEAHATVQVLRSGTLLGVATHAGGTTFRFQFSAGQLVEGENVITARARDATGLLSDESSPLTITLDTTPPPAPVLPPDLVDESDTGRDSADNITFNNTPVFSLAGEGPYFRLDRGGVQVSGDYEGAEISLPPQSDGLVDFVAYAMDAAGNRSALPSPPLWVRIDTVAPTILPIGDQEVLEDATLGPLPFQVSDSGTLPTALTVVAASSNTALVPDANIVVTQDGTSWTVTVTPVASRSGTTVITLTAEDPAGNTSQSSFLLTVLGDNDPPTISEIDDVTIVEDGTAGPIPFQVDDPERPDDLTVEFAVAGADGPLLLPEGSITLDGSGQNRTLTIRPAADRSGTATITLTVADPENSTSTTSFHLTVTPVNDEPTVSPIVKQEIDEDHATAPLAFTVADVESTPDRLIVTVESDDPVLVPPERIAVVMNGASGTVTVTPAADRSGSATIRLTVTDPEGATGNTEFSLTVREINDRPTITGIDDQTISARGSTGPLAFQITDVETAPDGLTITRQSSDTDLVPLAGMVVQRAGGDCTVTVTPAANRVGTAVVTLTVSDGDLSDSASFVLTVNSTNRPPTGVELDGLVVPENAPGAVVGTFSVTDPDVDDTHTFDLSDLRFEADGMQLKLRSGASLDFETERQIVLDVTVTDSGVPPVTREARFTLWVTDANDPPEAIALEQATVAEHAVGQLVGRLTVTDPDADDAHELRASDSRFEVWQGYLKLKPDVQLDYEGEPSVPLVITAADHGGLEYEEAFVISVENVNEEPTEISLSHLAVAENEPGAVIGDLLVSDPDIGDEHTFGFFDSRFEAAAGQLKLKDGEALDYEAQDTVVVRVAATDAEGLSVVRQFTISVSDENDAPSAVELSNDTVTELRAGAVVGNLSAVDQDAADVHTFQVHDPRFEVVGVQLRLRPDQSLLRADGAVVIVDVSVTDSGTPQRTTRLGVAVQVVPNPSPWQNSSYRFDVNHDGVVSAQDVLLIINDLNRDGFRDLPAPPGDPRYYPDANGDNRLQPDDVLAVINHINSGAAGEGESSGAALETVPARPAFSAGRFAAADGCQDNASDLQVRLNHPDESADFPALDVIFGAFGLRKKSRGWWLI